MNGWRELNRNNIPSDILVGEYEFEQQQKEIKDDQWIKKTVSIVMLRLIMEDGCWRFRIRRPEGWEPSELDRFKEAAEEVALMVSKLPTAEEIGENMREVMELIKKSKPETPTHEVIGTGVITAMNTRIENSVPCSSITVSFLQKYVPGMNLCNKVEIRNIEATK